MILTKCPFDLTDLFENYCPKCDRLFADTNDVQIFGMPESNQRYCYIEKRKLLPHDSKRWNIEEDGSGDLLICNGLHEKSEACNYIRYSAGKNDLLELAGQMASALRNLENLIMKRGDPIIQNLIDQYNQAFKQAHRLPIPEGYKLREPDETIKENDLYWNGTAWIEVPKIPEFVGMVRRRERLIIYRAG